MTELEHIEIEGFKGLEHVEFEPTDINLITGRNNTGKTSFLEAVDLLYNPNNLDNFGSNAKSVINIEEDGLRIIGEEPQNENQLSLRESSKEKLPKYFSALVIKNIKSQMSFFGSVSVDMEDVISLVKSVTERVFQKDVTQSDLEQFEEDFLILEQSSEEHVYFSGAKRSRIVLDHIVQELFEELDEEFIEDSDYPSNTSLSDWNSPKIVYDSEVQEFVPSIFSGIGSRNNGTFLTRPSSQNSANFIKSVNLTGGIEDADDEDAVKIDDIGDYIVKTGIVSGLKTFTPDYLVFEENGEKRQIPYEFMGDGFKTIVGLLWELMDNEVENDIVLLEEPETHMHPGYIREVVYFLINLAREEDVQLFITTHDSDFINDFFTENLTDEEEAYLKEEFSLLRMEEDSAVVEDYETARENLKDLHLDLRGI